MLYQLSYFRISRFTAPLCRCGRRWIRTTVGVSQQIYSLPHLTTLVSSQNLKYLEPMEGVEPTTPRLQITCSDRLSYIGNFVPFLCGLVKGTANLDIYSNFAKNI